MKTKDYPIQPCTECGQPFKPVRMPQMACSRKCRLARTAARRDNFQLGLAAGTVGAVAELMVCVDLMKRGYEVFRALSPSCSCDVLAMKDNKTLKVEVRTARHVLATGKLSYPPNNIRAEQLALVTHRDSSIHYVPDLPQ